MRSRRTAGAAVLAIAVVGLGLATPSSTASATGTPSPAWRPASTSSAHVVVNGTKSSKDAIKPGASKLSGTVYFFARGVKHASKASYSVDGKHPFATTKASKGSLPPAKLETTTLKDGKHTLTVKLSGSKVSPKKLTASFTTANDVAGPDLIAQSLSLHRIDFGTSLIDRMYSIWGDSALPADLRGTGPGLDSDGGVADQYVDYAYNTASLEIGTLPTAEQKKLRPFIDRPTDPDTVFSGPPSSTDAAARPLAHPLDGCILPKGWFGESMGPITAWSQDQGDVDIVQSVANQVLANEQADGMGNLQSDNGSSSRCDRGNPDSSLDVYVVDKDQYSPRGKNNHTPGAPAWTVALKYGCSSYMVVDRSQLGSAGDFRRVMAHEMYHALSFAHLKAPTCFWNYWFFEASAQWAEAFYSKDANGQVSPDATAVQSEQLTAFQKSQPRSLESCAECPEAYQAFEWPLFMAQESGPKTVNSVWNQMADVTTAQEALQKLDSVFSFKKHFRDFAARDIDDPAYAFHDQGSTDEAPSFQDAPIDPAPWLPEQEPASFAPTADDPFVVPQTDGATKTTKVTAPEGLSASYFVATMGADDNDATFDFSALPKSDQVDALVRVAGHEDYERRELSDRTLSFCRGNQADDINQVVFVISNPSTAAQDAQYANMSYTTDTACTGVSGHLSLQADGSQDHTTNLYPGYEEDKYTYDNTGSVTLDFPTGDLSDNLSSSTLSGTTTQSNHRVLSGVDATYTGNGTWDGTLNGDDAVQAVLSRDEHNNPIAYIYVDLDAPGNGSGTPSGTPDQFSSCSDSFDMSWGTMRFIVPLDSHGDGTLNVSTDQDDDTYGGPYGESNCTQDADYQTYSITGTITVTGATS